MRAVFVDNFLVREGDVSRDDIQPHLGLISLIGAAVAAGHDAVVYDPKLDLVNGVLRLAPGAYDTMADRILELHPEVVGFTTLGCTMPCVATVAKLIRSRSPEIPIVLGGPHATILASDILKSFEFVDVVVRGEADETVGELLSAFESGSTLSSLPGVSFRSPLSIGGVRSTVDAEPVDDLDRLPTPYYEAYPIRGESLTSLRVEAGRGCPFQCTFCSTATFFGRKYRLKSAEGLVGRLEDLRSEYGVSDFGLTHDMFTANREKVREFCRVVAGRGLSWTCSARMDCVDPALLQQMQTSGCRSIYFGVETGSPRMQLEVKKNLKLSLVEPCLRLCSDLGLETVVSFIIGYPQERMTDLRQTLDMAGHCLNWGGELVDIQIHLLTPEPGTGLLDEYRDHLKYDGYTTDFNFPLIEAEDRDLVLSHPEIFVNHYFYDNSHISRSTLCAISEAFWEWSTLGRKVLAASIERFGDGSLGTLLLNFVHSDADSPEDYAADCLGTDELVSHIKYATAVVNLRKRRLRSPTAPAGANTHAADERLEPSPDCMIIGPLHNCAQLISRSESSESDSSADHYYALIRDAEGASDRVRVLEIDETSANLVVEMRSSSGHDALSYGDPVTQASPSERRERIAALAEIGVLVVRHPSPEHTGVRAR